MYSSGTVAAATAGPNPVTAIALPSPACMYNHLTVWNGGSGAGFFSVDGGNTWAFIPAATAFRPGYAESWQQSNSNVQIKRQTIDMSAVYLTAEWLEAK